MANEFIVRKGLISIGGDVIINRDGGNYNFTIESPADSNLLVANYTNNNITIGNTASSGYKLGAWSTSSAYTIYSYNSNSSGGTAIYGTAQGYGTTNIAVRGEASNAFSANYGGYFSSTNTTAELFGVSYGIYVSTTEGSRGNAIGGYFATAYNGNNGNSYGIYIVDTSSATGSADFHGIYVSMSGTFTGTVNNSYGIRINNSTNSGDGLYAIYTENGDNYLNVSSGRTGIGIAPSASLTLRAGTGTAGFAPLKLTTGSLLGTAEIGAVEYLNPILYFTNGDAIRQKIPAQQFGCVLTTQSRTLDITYTNLTGMTVTLVANRRYELDVYLIISAVTGTGAQGKFNFTGTIGWVSYISYVIKNNNTITDTNRIGNTSFPAIEFSDTTIVGAGYFCKGQIDVGATGGVLTFQVGQAASNAGATFFDQGSFIKVTVIE